MPQQHDVRRYAVLVQRHASTIALACFLAFVLLLGAWRIRSDTTMDAFVALGTGSLVLEGRITDAPEIADTTISYIVGDLSVLSGSTVLSNLPGHVALRDSRMWPRHYYRETIRIGGKLSLSEEDGYGRALRTRGIQATMFRPFIETMQPAPFSAFGLLITVREAIELRIRQLFPEPQASLAVGLLTGTRASFPTFLTEALRRSGLTHITAVSGSNVAIVLSLLETLLFWIPRRWRLGPLCAGLFLFTLFTGASASVVRAAIMGALGVLALHAGRIAQARRTILWTAGFMLLWNPRLLAGDLGFQLSFLSVIGILEVSPHLEPLLTRVPNVLALRESIALTLASQLTAGPWIAYALGNFSLVSLPANLLAAPLIPWAMLLSAIAVVVSPFGLGLPAAFIAHLPLQLIIAAAEGTASLPFASLDGLAVPFFVLVLYYLLLTGAIVWANRNTGPERINSFSSRYPQTGVPHRA